MRGAVLWMYEAGRKRNKAIQDSDSFGMRLFFSKRSDMLYGACPGLSCDLFHFLLFEQAD
jgi:hypothetical protein